MAPITGVQTRGRGVMLPMAPVTGVFIYSWAINSSYNKETGPFFVRRVCPAPGGEPC